MVGENMDRIFSHLNQKNRETSKKNHNSGIAMGRNGYNLGVESPQEIYRDRVGTK